MYDLPDRFTAPPTPEQLAVLEKRLSDANAAPLRPGASLPFQLEERFKDAQVHPQTLETVTDSPMPRRPLDHILIAALTAFPSPGRSSNLSIRLVSSVRIGVPLWSQVWVGEVEKDGRRVGEVVVKFLVEALFPFPRGEEVRRAAEQYDWRSGRELATAEARAYAAFRPVQGRDVPYCYGVGSFRMPWGEEALGLLLEDLSEKAKTLQAANAWDDMENVQADEIDGLVHFSSTFFLLSQNLTNLPQICRLFETQRRLQDLGVVQFEATHTNILVLKETQDINDPKVVFLDFGTTISAADHRRFLHVEAEWARQQGFGYEVAEDDWRGGDEAHLETWLYELFGDAMAEWRAMENRRNLLGLVRE
ncbi:hypothetical protein JCM6882_005023 [Rhodosporidiobolus microsporus]